MCACVVCLAIVTGLLSGDTSNTTRSNAGISFIYLFMVCYSVRAVILARAEDGFLTRYTEL